MEGRGRSDAPGFAVSFSGREVLPVVIVALAAEWREGAFLFMHVD